MKTSLPVGELELEVLRFIGDHMSASVGEVAEAFAESRGLARTTVQTVMERLRKKGYLVREEEGGMFRYALPAAQEDVHRNLVRDFIKKAFGGSLSPVAAYLADATEVTDEEFAELQQQVERLRSRTNERGSEDR